MEIKEISKDCIFVRLDKGEEIVSTLEKICIDNKIGCGTISGIGATNDVQIGLFNTKKKIYRKKVFQQDMEIVTLSGNITLLNDKPYLHLHISLADEKQGSYGGHLNYAVISATGEIFITRYAGGLSRIKDPETNLNLISTGGDKNGGK